MIGVEARAIDRVLRVIVPRTRASSPLDLRASDPLLRESCVDWSPAPAD